MAVCGGWSLAKVERGGLRAITLFCRSWLCSDCLPRRLAALKREALSGNPTTFMTLTVNPQRGESVEIRARELSDALKILVKRARRKWTKSPLEYFAVFEETKKGEPHLHLVMRAPYIPQAWLSNTMAELIGAPIVDIRKVGSARGVAKYVAKYVAKGPRGFGALKRYWSSRGYSLTVKPERKSKSEFDPHWTVEKRSLWQLAARYGAIGYSITWDGDRGFEAILLAGHRLSWPYWLDPKRGELDVV